MMAAIFYLSFTVVSLTFCQAEISVSDYIYWKKSDINSWNKFFPSRALEEERQTNLAANDAINSLPYGLSEYLSKIVAFQYRELETAMQLMAGTDAEGCINGISNFINQTISDQIDSYEECTADAQSKMSRLNYNLARLNTTYLASLQRALAGIDACAKTYPNKDSIDRLRSCVESMNKAYFTAANNTQNSVFPSPSMTYFQTTVVGCASNAAKTVAAKGSQFLKMLVNCAALSGTVDPTSYAEELNEWKGYNDTLAEQITLSQNDNYYQVWAVESDMIKVYELQKQALEEYVIESRGFDFYLSKVYAYLSDYYNTVTATTLDNPGDSGCVAAAKSALDNVASLGATRSLTCDQAIVNDTKLKLAEIYNNFANINDQMTLIGNKAILDCFSQGFIYAPNTIRDCYKLTYNDFSLNNTEINETSSGDIVAITKYIDTFFNTYNLPCGGSSLNRLTLGADRAMYDLQRCLYKSSGTTYEVTTPPSFDMSTTESPLYN